VKRNKKASNDVRLTGPKGEDPPIRANKKAPLAIHSLRPTWQPRKLQNTSLIGIPKHALDTYTAEQSPR